MVAKIWGRADFDCRQEPVRCRRPDPQSRWEACCSRFRGNWVKSMPRRRSRGPRRQLRTGRRSGRGKFVNCSTDGLGVSLANVGKISNAKARRRVGRPWWERFRKTVSLSFLKRLTAGGCRLHPKRQSGRRDRLRARHQAKAGRLSGVRLGKNVSLTLVTAGPYRS